jgi:serine/threonine-protein kinase HipA
VTTVADAPDGRWTGRHQMSVNGKRDDFTLEDFRRCGETASLPRALEIVEEVSGAVARWTEHATAAAVPERDVERIGRTHRLALPRP